VTKIFHVICDDIENPAHSDASMEESLRHLGVEELDWRKLDLCPRTLREIGQELRVLHLYWGGNNAILRAWSATDGLAKLSKLELVTIRVEKVGRLPTLHYPRPQRAARVCLSVMR
jgi:hypothetical protein